MSRMVSSRHDDMNLYAASVALLWTTAMHPSAVSRARAHGEPLPRARRTGTVPTAAGMDVAEVEAHRRRRLTRGD